MVNYLQDIGNLEISRDIIFRDILRYDKWLDYFWILGLQFDNNNLPRLPKLAKFLFKYNNLLKEKDYRKELILRNNKAIFIEHPDSSPRIFKGIKDKLGSDNYDIINMVTFSTPFYKKMPDNATLSFKRNKACILYANMISRIFQSYMNDTVFSKSHKEFIKNNKKNIDFYFSNEMISIIKIYYDEFCNIIRENNPKCFIVEDVSDIRIRTLVKACERFNIPVLHIYHGLGIEKSSLCISPIVIKCVPGSYARDALISLGYPSNKVLITGPVFMDDIKPSTTIDDYNLLLTQVIWEDGFITKEEYFNEINKMMKEFADVPWKLIIKMHPREKGKKDYEDLCRKYRIKNFEVIGKEGDLHKLIENSNMVFAYGSTAVIEAIAYKKKVKLYNLFPWHYKGSVLFETLFNITPDKYYDYITNNILLNNRAVENVVELIK